MSDGSFLACLWETDILNSSVHFGSVTIGLNAQLHIAKLKASSECIFSINK